jgi:hypothetical protein
VTAKFSAPSFGTYGLELRCDGDEVSVYGTRDGLRRLCDLIMALVDNPGENHIHLEDYELLTKESLIGAVAVFRDPA